MSIKGERIRPLGAYQEKRRTKDLDAGKHPISGKGARVYGGEGDSF